MRHTWQNACQSNGKQRDTRCALSSRRNYRRSCSEMFLRTFVKRIHGARRLGHGSENEHVRRGDAEGEWMRADGNAGWRLQNIRALSISTREQKWTMSRSLSPSAHCSARQFWIHKFMPPWHGYLGSGNPQTAKTGSVDGYKFGWISPKWKNSLQMEELAGGLVLNNSVRGNRLIKHISLIFSGQIPWKSRRKNNWFG